MGIPSVPSVGESELPKTRGTPRLLQACAQILVSRSQVVQRVQHSAHVAVHYTCSLGVKVWTLFALPDTQPHCFGYRSWYNVFLPGYIL